MNIPTSNFPKDGLYPYECTHVIDYTDIKHTITVILSSFEHFPKQEMFILPLCRKYLGKILTLNLYPLPKYLLQTEQKPCTFALLNIELNLTSREYVTITTKVTEKLSQGFAMYENILIENF